MTFRSGAPVTLDLAWPEFKVAIEYDGDHHRTNKTQWRRDQEKRSKLVARQWITFVATAANLADEVHVLNSHSMWHVLLLCEVQYSIFR